MNYTPLRISTIKPGRELTFDLYIYFKEHYLCYTKRGTQLTSEKHQKLKKQKIAKFYISENDEINYQKFLDSLLDETLSNPLTSSEDKRNLAESAATTAVERMHKKPTELAYRSTEKAVKNLHDIILNDPEALKKIFGKNAEDNEELLKHSLNVCALSIKLAMHRKCTSQEIQDLGTAALIHDMGVASMPPENMALFNRPKKDLSNEERKAFYEHCHTGAELLKGKSYVNPTILELVLNHEEVLSGLGPNKKKKLTKLEEILSLVNNYDKRVITSKTTPAQSLKDIMIDELGNYDLGLLNDFKALLQSEGLI